MPNPFLLTAITADSAIIRAADSAGVDRIGIDIERLGKLERQGHIPGARISTHLLDDLQTVVAHARHAEIFLRINPLHAASRQEIQLALDLGAQAIMLPYFSTARQADAFVNLVQGRAQTLLLLETATAAANVQEIVAVPGIGELMVGLNDLHLDLGLRTHFDVVVSPLMASVSAATRAAGLRFGFGGLARIHDSGLPVSPDLVCAQYPRLGATSAWLSRSFFHRLPPAEIAPAVIALRRRIAYWSTQSPAALDHQRQRLTAHLSQLRSAG